jgi:acetyl-CoA carboxylase biotin carboxyl carrier protein
MGDRLADEIALLAAMFSAGGWTDLRVESGAFRLALSTDRAAPGLTPTIAPALTPTAAAPAVMAAVPVAVGAAIDGGNAAPADAAGWAEVRTPNLGTFYRSPKPGAPPFVEIGQRVAAGTEVCLLEVMKLFTSVKAGVSGTIREICVEDGVLVEGGQLLFRVDAD